MRPSNVKTANGKKNILRKRRERFSKGKKRKVIQLS